MSMLKRLSTLILTGVSLLSLQGCLATAVVTSAAVATKVATDPRSAGTQIDDEILEERVAHNLNNDAQLKEEARINVVAYNGKILLIGQAPNQSASESAKNLAAGVNGVSDVYNEIRVGVDSYITSVIKSKLLVNSEVKTTEVKVITENGEVFLMGKLDAQQADAAAEVARNVSGVTKVIKVITYAQ